MLQIEQAIYGMRNWSLLGILIYRQAAADPQNVWLPLFHINGIVCITGLFGRRTAAQAGGVSTMQFRHSIIPSILDDGSRAITGDVVDTLYTCDGDPTDPIISGVTIIPGAFFPFMLTHGGNIEVTMTAAAGTGSTEYWMNYLPITPGANITPL
jgi:hypothetical protein